MKVLSSGRVDIYNQHVISGNIPNDVLDIVNSATGLSSGYDLIWGNYTYNQTYNPGLLKLATNYSTKFIVKSNGKVGICTSNPSWELDVIGTGGINGAIILTSDERLKENMLPIKNTTPDLLKLTAIEYNLKLTPEDYYFNGKEQIIEKDSMRVLKNKFDESFYFRKHFGFSAQKVQEVFPELVYEDSLGILSIDYIGLIPIIVETMKEHDAKIVTLNQKISELETRISSLENGTAEKKSFSSSDVTNGRACYLLQNSPNPFNQATEIKYYLTENVYSASLYLYDMQGLQIRSYNIEKKGEGIISIDGNELEAGIYMYSLIADGKEVDTKKMILTQ